MKRVTTVFFIFIIILFLNSCSLNVNEPNFDDYKISNYNFSEINHLGVSDIQNIDQSKFENALRSNVWIDNYTFNFKNMNFVNKRFVGSGVIFHESENYYYVLTNANIVVKPNKYKNQEIKITDFYGNTYNAYIYHRSLYTNFDLVILVFPKIDQELGVVDIASGYIREGRDIISIGNTLKKKNIYNYGKVLDYQDIIVFDEYGYMKQYGFSFIIHNGNFEKGFNGSMLLNYDMDLIGLNMINNSDTNTKQTFAIPSSIITDYIKLIIKN